jgi:hypothetical protein
MEITAKVVRIATPQAEFVRSLQRKSTSNVRRRATRVGEAAVHNCDVYAIKHFKERIPSRRRYPSTPRAVGSFSFDVVGEMPRITLSVTTKSKGAGYQQVGTEAHTISARDVSRLTVPKPWFRHEPQFHTRYTTAQLAAMRPQQLRRPLTVNHPGSKKHKGFMTEAVRDAIGYVAYRYRRR